MLQFEPEFVSLSIFRLKPVSFLPLLYRLKPHALSAVLRLHGGSFQATEQQPVGKIAQVWGGHVTQLLLQELMDNTLGATCRAAVHHPGEERDQFYITSMVFPGSCTNWAILA